MVPLDKIRARKLGLQKRNELNLQTKEKYDQLIFSHVVQRLEGYKKIGIYVSIKNEVDTRALIKHFLMCDSYIFVPKVTNHTLKFIQIHGFEDLEESTFSLLEPKGLEKIPVEDLDVMIVPVVAYDEFHHRVGFGQGYYDSILKKSKRNIGLAYSCQKMDVIEMDSWDVDLDEIITEKGFEV